MRRIIWVTGVAALLLMVASCAPEAFVEKDPSRNLANYRTYAWVETKASQDHNGPSPAEFAKLSVRNAVNEQLTRMGWQKVTENPDVLVSYDVLVEKSTQQINDPIYTQPFVRYYFNPWHGRWAPIYYPSHFIGWDSRTVPVREATLSVNFMDARTDEKIMQGWTTRQVGSNFLSQSEVRRSVRSIFNRIDNTINA